MGHDPHSIGMTYLFLWPLSKPNEPLWSSPADSISPGFDDNLGEGRLSLDPPANDGSKVVLLDTDHFSPFSSSALWVWKAFLRGHHPILSDLGILSGVPPSPSEGMPSFDSLEPPRRAIGGRSWLCRADRSRHLAATARANLHRVRRGRPRQGVPDLAAQRNGRTVHDRPVSWPLRSRVAHLGEP
jgi:hypothetical protein